MTIFEWEFLIFVTFSVILFPCALAFWIEYETLPIGLGCRSLTILVYTASQFFLILLSAWSHFKAGKSQAFWEAHRQLNRLKRRSIGILVAIFVMLPAWVSAIFTTFAGTLMQITGIHQNCVCSVPATKWLNLNNATIELATDTELDRLPSVHWKQAGYIALGFLACVTYLGYWCQRYLRDQFVARVRLLASRATRRLEEDLEDTSNQETNSAQDRDGGRSRTSRAPENTRSNGFSNSTVYDDHSSDYEMGDLSHGGPSSLPGLNEQENSGSGIENFCVQRTG